MNDLKAEFEQAQRAVKRMTKRPGDDDLLILYALFRQATDGDAPTIAPNPADKVGYAKYEAWAALRGQSAELAMSGYVRVAKRLEA